MSEFALFGISSMLICFTIATFILSRIPTNIITDEYDVKLYADYLAEHPIMLAYGINGQPLDAETAPVRIIIRNSDSAYWVRMVNKIEFEK